MAPIAHDWKIRAGQPATMRVPIIDNGRRVSQAELASGAWTARCEATGFVWSTAPTLGEGAITFGEVAVAGDGGTDPCGAVQVQVTAEESGAWEFTEAPYALYVTGPSGIPDTRVAGQLQVTRE